MNAGDNGREDGRQQLEEQPGTVTGSIAELREFLKRQQRAFENERQQRTNDGIIDEPEPYRVRVGFRSNDISEFLSGSMTSAPRWWRKLAMPLPRSWAREPKVMPAPAAEPADTPPKWSEYALFLFLPRKHRDNIPGDLREEFATEILPRFGARAARNWYRYQVACAIASLWPRRVLAALGLTYLARKLPGLERWLGG